MNWLGDAVMTTPALLRLRHALPQTQIALLTPEKLADLWHRHPAVDDVFVLATNESPWKVGRQLRRERFDAAIAFPNSHRSALELWWARIPRRIGYTAPFRDCLLTDPIPRSAHAGTMHKRSGAEIRRLTTGPPPPRPLLPPQAHHLHQYLPLVAPLGALPQPLPPLLTISDHETEAARRQFCADANPAHPLAALNPGAEYGPAKRWPAERFAAAAHAVHRRHPCHWLLLGGPADAPLTSRLAADLLAAGVPVRDLAGRTSLRELCALLRLSRVVLTNDSGPMHVAAALGTPVVALFGSTSPELTGPGMPHDPRHCVLHHPPPCAPCFRRECPIDYRCLTQLTIEEAAAAVLARLSTAHAAHAPPPLP